MSTEAKAGSSAWARAASALALLVYFALASRDGLNAYFTMDDGGNIVNLHKYWTYSLAGVAGAALRVVTGAYRPMGGLYYFTLYKLVGYNPVPFRAVCLVLMALNLLLAFELLRRLSGSLPAGLMGALLMVHHPVVLELLYSSGTIYEILCFLFYFLALLCYFVWRQAGHAIGETTLSWRRLTLIVLLTGGALDSKEMAMTLPAALLLIELIYFTPDSWRWRTIGRYAIRQGRVALITAALVIPTIAVKVLTKNPLSDDSRYHSHSISAAVDGMRAYHHFLLYGPISSLGFSTVGLLVLWAVMAAVAMAMRCRPMKFGLCFLIAALIPVCLIAPRGGYMLYLPLMGWALYFGSLFQRLVDEPIQGAGLGRSATALRFAAFACVAALIINTHAEIMAPYAANFRDHQAETRRMIDRLRKVHPQLAPGSSLLLVDDPIEPGFEVLLLAQLAYADPTLELVRTKMLAATPTESELTRYDLVLAGGWDFHDVRGIHDPRPPLELGFHRRADGYSLEIPELAGQDLELATRMMVDGSKRTTLQQHGRLDAFGRAVFLTPADGPPATIRVRWVRPQGGDWMSAAAID